MRYGTAAAAMAVAMVLAATSHAHAEGEDAAEESVSLWIPDRMIAGEQYHGMIIAGEARPGGLLAYLSTGDDHVAAVPSTASVGPYRNHAIFPVTPGRPGDTEILAAVDGGLYRAATQVVPSEWDPAGLKITPAANRTKTDSMLAYVTVVDQNGVPIAVPETVWVELSGTGAVSVRDTVAIKNGTSQARFEVGVRGSGGIVASADGLAPDTAEIERIHDEFDVGIGVAPGIAMPDSYVFYYVWLERDGRPYSPPYVVDAVIHSDNWEAGRLEENPSVRRPDGMHVRMVDGVAKGVLYTGSSGHATITASVAGLGSAHDDLFVGPARFLGSDPVSDPGVRLAEQDLLSGPVQGNPEPNILLSWTYPPVTDGRAWVVTASYHAYTDRSLQSGGPDEPWHSHISQDTLITPAATSAGEFVVNIASSPELEHGWVHHQDGIPALRTNAMEIGVYGRDLGRYEIVTYGHNLRQAASSVDVVSGHTQDLRLGLAEVPLLPGPLYQDLAVASVFDRTGAMVDVYGVLGRDTEFSAFADGAVRLAGDRFRPVHANSAIVGGMVDGGADASISVTLDGVGIAERTVSARGAASSLEILAPHRVHAGEEFAFAIHELDGAGTPIRRVSEGIKFFSPDVRVTGSGHLVAREAGPSSISAISDSVGAAEHGLDGFENSLDVEIHLDRRDFRTVEEIEVRASSSVDADYELLSEFGFERTGRSTFLIRPDAAADSSTITVVASRDGYETATASESVSVREEYSVDVRAADSGGGRLAVPFGVSLDGRDMGAVSPYHAELGPGLLRIDIQDTVSLEGAGYVLAGMDINGEPAAGRVVEIRLDRDMLLDVSYDRVVLVSVIDGAGSGVYGYGEAVTISAPDRERVSFLIRDVFDRWDGLPPGHDSSRETIVALHDMEITAVYREDYTYLMVSVFVPLLAGGAYVVSKSSAGFKWRVQNMLEAAARYVPSAGKAKAGGKQS